MEASELKAALARRAHACGWALATAGNFGAVIAREPLRLAITGSGIDKGGCSSGAWPRAA